MSKIIGIVGSARKKGNTDLLVDKVLSGAEACGVEIEKIYLSDLQFQGCIGCEGCLRTRRCVLKDDMQTLYEKLNAAHGWVLGSPTYFYNVSALMKMFIDRLYVYEVFDVSDRSVWLSPAEVLGAKYAVTVAVCEQKDEADMGFTSEAMRLALQAVGVRSVENLKVLHLFQKGEALRHETLLQNAYNAGEKLAKTVALADTVRLDNNASKGMYTATT